MIFDNIEYFEFGINTTVLELNWIHCFQFQFINSKILLKFDIINKKLMKLYETKIENPKSINLK